MAGFGVDRSSVASGSGASASSIPESIIDAKGDLIAGASADTPTRVAVGTNEQRLVADSTQGGGLAWKSDTTNYAITAKGELLVGTAADTVAPLTIGAAGEILMPASGASTGAAWLRFPPAGAYLINGKIARSVAASALTLAVKTLADADPSTSSPVYVLMPTATSNVLDGGYTIRSITGALSMTVSSGSTLGHTSAVASPVVVYLIDNAGTLELAVSTKFFGGASVQTTTAEGGAGGADSATTLYSTTLRSNVVAVCVQSWESTQSTAGTWAVTTGQILAYPFRTAAGADGTVAVARSSNVAGVVHAAALTKAIHGWTYANNGSDAANDLDIAAGGGMDATGAYWIAGGALTKQSDVAWAVGTNAGGLDTGVVGNSDYYIWAIARSDTGVVDYLFSLSSTAPTMPAGYDYKRLIGWFKRAGGGIAAFHTYETEGGGLEFAWDAPAADISLSNTLTTSRRTDTLRVPLGFSTRAEIVVQLVDASAEFGVQIWCPDVTDAAAALTTSTTTYRGQAGANGFIFPMSVRTSSAGLIASRSNLATVDTYVVSTMGFRWSRR